MLQQVVEVLGNKINQMSIIEIYLYLLNTNPYFNAIHSNISDIYYDVTESVDILSHLVEQQMSSGKNKFLTDLANVINRRVPNVD